MATKDHITLRIDPDVHFRLKIMADREQRTLSNMIHKLLRMAVERDKVEYPIAEEREA